VVSLYYHYKYNGPAAAQHPDATDRDLILEQDMSLEEWVFEGKRPAVDNGIVRQIAGGKLPPFGQCPDTLLSEALEHINQKFAAVLIRGRMGQSLEILSRLTGTPIRSLERQNVNKKRTAVADIDPALRRRIQDLNSLDHRLFQLMLERLPGTYESIVGRRAPIAQAASRPAARPSEPARVTPAATPGLSVGDQTLCFLHIPKTGGTALRDALKGAYEKDERAFVYEPEHLRDAVSRDELVELPVEQRRRLRLVLGHYPYGIHEAVGRPCRYLTILREPVERVISLYHHHQELHLSGMQRFDPRRHVERIRFRRQPMPLEEWIFEQNRLAVDNGMTRNLAGRRRVRFGKCPDDLLDEALEHVEQHFAALLVTDRLDESRPLLEQITGRPLKPLTHANRNRRRRPLDEVDPRLLERIRELNHLDVRLYQTAQERLEPLLG
jgi:hypothetical protein